MTPERWDRISALYVAALEQVPDARAGFLAAACADDVDLRHEVESLLRQELDSTPAFAALAPGSATNERGSASGARLGPYRLGPLIGAGGMGEVYRARDETLARDVAIKILPTAFAAEAGRRARFEREARVLASLNHPHIAAIYGVVEGEGHRGLVLELVDGETLAERVQRVAPGARAGLPLAEVVGIARQLVEALDAAHERGIVHRDLKPANIKITPEGLVKVLDFGLATAVSGDAAADLTQSPTITVGATGAGVLLGTAPYMSPEQARGLSVDKRADIWAFGCVLYEMLTGRAAFAGDTLTDTLAAIIEREPDWAALPGSTPAGVALLVRRCLEKNVKQRLRDIGDAFNETTDDVRPVAVRVAARLSARIAWSVAGFTLAAAVAIVLWHRTSLQSAFTRVLNDAQFSGITSDDSFSTEPTISRDGSTVVYASDRAGNLDLWLQLRSGGPPRRLTFDSAHDREPDLSPDGSHVAFRSDRDGGGVYVMPTSSGDALLVVEKGRGPRFSRDGSRIAYWTGPWLDGAGERGRSSMFIVPVSAGGQPTRVADEFATAREPIWSPDGQSLLFFGRKSEDGEFDWWWAPLDGREPRATGAYAILAGNGLLTAGAAEGAAAVFDAVPTAWVPAGVIFSARRGESVNLWRLNVSERSGEAIGESLVRLTKGAGSDVSASADDMGRIAFQVNAEGAVSLTVPLDPNSGRVTGDIRRHTFHAPFGNRNSLDHAGRVLAYSKQRMRESEIWVKNIVSGEERLLVSVTPPSSPLNPIISPDGRSVAYRVRPGHPSAGAFVIPASGGKTTKICDDCGVQGWFADSRRILSGRNKGPLRVVRAVDVVDGTTTDLVVAQNEVSRADVSPDGRWLSFGTEGHVWIVPVRPGNPPPRTEWVRVLAVPEGSAERPCGWSPDSQMLYLMLERDGFRDLYAQRIDAARGTPVGEPFVVKHLHDAHRRWGSTPFGTGIVSNAFVFNQVEMTGRIWLLDPNR